MSEIMSRNQRTNGEIAFETILYSPGSDAYVTQKMEIQLKLAYDMEFYFFTKEEIENQLELLEITELFDAKDGFRKVKHLCIL